MAISVILISSGSSDDSVATPVRRVILDTYYIIIPSSPDYTPASPDYSPASDTESDPSEDPSSDHIPPLPAISPFLSSANDTTDSDAPDTTPSPTHDLSSEASSDFHLDASSDSSLRHSLSDHSSLDLSSTSAGPSRKMRRDSGYLADVEVDPRETSLRDDVMVRDSDEPHLEQDIDLEIQAEIDECIAYEDALRDRGFDARVVVEAVYREESKTGTRGLVKVRVERVMLLMMPEDTPEPAQEKRVIECAYETLGSLVQRFHDHTEAIPVYRIQVIKGVQREQGRRIVRVESAVTALTERVAELERDNRRLRGITSVENQRVDRVQRDMSRM
nr:hypothetical protein [Tanacetum cinerariifolium]